MSCPCQRDTAGFANHNVLMSTLSHLKEAPQSLHHDERHQPTNGDDYEFLFASRAHSHPDRRRNMGYESVHFIPTRLCTSA